MLNNPKWNNTNPVARILLEGADLIEKHGHTKGQLYGNDGSMCFMGALHKARYSKPADEYPAALAAAVADAVQKAMNIPDAYYPKMWPNASSILAVVAWNNAPERTGQEVIDAMRFTAAMLPAEEKEDVHS